MSRWLNQYLSWFDEERREAIVIAALLAVLFFALIPPFLYVVHQLRHRAAGLAPPQTAVDAASLPTAAIGLGQLPPGQPAATRVLAAPGSPLPTPEEEHRWQEFQEPTTGLRMEVPDGWRQATVHHDGGPAQAADVEVVFEAPDSGARLAVSAWDNRVLTSFNLWVGTVAQGERSVDGRLPTNAEVAGRPALVAWAPETAVTPARYATYLERDRWFIRIAYTAADGGSALADYARCLVTLHFGDAEEGTVDTIPPLPAPTGRYYPSARLFEASP